MPFVLRRDGDQQNPRLVRVFGDQSTAGQLCYYTKIGDQTAFILFLGEGEKYGEGEFDSILWYRYGGHLLAPYDAATGQGHWILHRGTYSTGFADPNQGRPIFFPNLDFTFSGKAYVEVKLPANLSTGEEEPTRSEIRVRGSRINDYDVTGAIIPASYGPSANNIREFIYCMKLARKLTAANHATRIDWSSYVDARARCDAQIGYAAGGGDGLTGNYYSDATLSALALTRIDGQISFAFGTAQADLPAVPFSVRWTGFIEAPVTGTYRFSAIYDDGIRLWVNGVQLINDFTVGSARESSGTIALTTGTKYSITVEYLNQANIGEIRLSYQCDGTSLGKQIIPRDRLFSSATISTNGRTVNRWDGDMVFPGTPLPAALSAIMARCPDIEWQEVNGKIRFLSDKNRPSVFTFYYDPTQTLTPSNIVAKSVTGIPRDPFQKANFVIIGYRDKDDEQLMQKYVPLDRSELRDQLDGQLVDPGILQIGVSRQSNAERVGEAGLRLNSDLDLDVNVKGQKGSHKVAKADRVTLVHPLGDWQGTPMAGHNGPIDMLVETEVFESTITTANEKSYKLREYDPEFSSDTDHGPLARKRVADVQSPYDRPPLVAAVALSEGLTQAKDGAIVAALNGVVTFTGWGYPQRARVWLKRPGEGSYSLTDRVLRPTSTLQDSFSIPGISAGAHYVKVVTETLSGNSFGVANAVEYNVTAIGKTAAPAAPTGLTATPGTGQLISLDWADNTESDLSEYAVYRNTVNNSATATKIAEVRASRFVDVEVTLGTQYFYWVSAINRSEIESAKSTGVNATPSTINAGSVDPTAPSAPTAATNTGSNYYLSDGGIEFSEFLFTLPGMPAGAAYQNLLFRRAGGSQWMIAGQFTNTGALTNVPIDDLTPGVSYDIATQAFSTFGVGSSITLATSSPFEAPTGGNRLRGRDTDVVDLSKVTSYTLTQKATERDADMIAFKVQCDFDAALSQSDATANLDSIQWVRVAVFDKFGNQIVSTDQPYRGRGIVGDFYITRENADFDTELSVSIKFFNAFGWNGNALWIAPNNTPNGTTQPTFKVPANCPTNLVGVAGNDNTVTLNWTWGGSARSVWMRAITGAGQGVAGAWTDITGSVTGDRVTTATVPNSLIAAHGRYEFRVNDGTAGAAGNASNISWLQAKDAPPATPERSAPSSLVLTELSSTSFRATWLRNATDNTDVQYSLDGGGWTDIGAVAGPFDVTGLVAGSVHTFKVRNKWSSGTLFSNESTTETIDLSDPGSSENDPSNLAIITNSRFRPGIEEPWSTRVRFTWQLNSGNPPTLYIYNGPNINGTLFDSVAFASGTTDSLDQTDWLPFSTEFTAVVRNGNGVNPSNAVTFTTVDLP